MKIRLGYDISFQTTPGLPMNLALYTHPSCGRGTSITLGALGPLTALNSRGGNDTTFFNTGNYVVFQSVPIAGTISGTYQPFGTQSGTAEGDLNGFQLVPVPEPASMGLLCAAASGLLIRRRRAMA